MALFGKKKPSAESGVLNELEEVEVLSADKDAMSFTPHPERARKFFEHARTAADTGNHAYAIHLFASGLKLDPEDMSAHRDMYESAIKLHSQGGKPAGRKDIERIDGSHPIERFAAAEFTWMRNLTSASAALKLIAAAAKAQQTEFARWFAPRLINILSKQKKPSKRDYVAAMEALEQLGVWSEALAAGTLALQLDSTDGNLATHIKNLSAQRAMDAGGYEEAGGAEGGFRKFVRDDKRQRELEEDASLSGAGGSEERVLDRLREQYEQNPLNIEGIRKYCQYLLRTGRPENEVIAKQVYLKAFTDTKEYQFKVLAGDITIRQVERRLAQLQEKVAKHPDDADLREELDTARRELLLYKSAEYNERAEKYPTNRTIRYQLGMLEYELGNFDSAIAAFQQSKDEPKLRVASGHMLGLCWAKEGWHMDAVGEFKEALAAIDPTTRDRELDIRYDLMVSLIEHSRKEKSLDLAKEALDICSSIARKDITYRDIRIKRKEVDELIKELSE